MEPLQAEQPCQALHCQTYYASKVGVVHTSSLPWVGDGHAREQYF